MSPFAILRHGEKKDLFEGRKEEEKFYEVLGGDIRPYAYVGGMVYICLLMAPDSDFFFFLLLLFVLQA